MSYVWKTAFITCNNCYSVQVVTVCDMYSENVFIIELTAITYFQIWTCFILYLMSLMSIINFSGFCFGISCFEFDFRLNNKISTVKKQSFINYIDYLILCGNYHTWQHKRHANILETTSFQQGIFGKRFLVYLSYQYIIKAL